MRIAIMGSGGVGAYVGARLQSAGEDVGFIARGAHLQAMQQDGLRIEGPDHPVLLKPVKATADPAELAPVDVVVFSVKLWDTADAARALVPLVGPETRVITLQNGIDSVAIISKELTKGHVVGGSIYVSAVIDRPGVIRSPGGFHRIVVDACNGDPVIAAFCAACNRAEALEAQAAEHFEVALWQKFIGLCAVSGSTTLLRANMGQILGNMETRAFLVQLFDEGMALAKAAGKGVPAEFRDTMIAGLETMPKSFRSSMSEDLERGKPLELPWLSGRMHKLGLELGVPTPGHTAVYRALVLHQNG